MPNPHSRYYTSEGEPITGKIGVKFWPYPGGHGEVLHLKDMSPEKQKEMLDLYSEPAYSERLRQRKVNGSTPGV